MRTGWGRAAVATVIIVVSLVAAASARAQQQASTRPDTDTEKVMRLTPAEVIWTAGPPMLPPGASMAVIEGSLSKPGPFTVRLRFPANYRIPRHWHPVGKMLPAGSIFEMPARIHHFGWTSEETVIQEHGIGPLPVHYLNATHGRR